MDLSNDYSSRLQCFRRITLSARGTTSQLKARRIHYVNAREWYSRLRWTTLPASTACDLSTTLISNTRIYTYTTGRFKNTWKDCQSNALLSLQRQSLSAPSRMRMERQWREQPTTMFPLDNAIGPRDYVAAKGSSNSLRERAQAPSSSLEPRTSTALHQWDC